METIDITPTWESLLPVLVEVAANGSTNAARNEAMGELRRLAQAVDRMNAQASVTLDLVETLKLAADYLDCIPEAAAGGDDEAGDIARQARAAIAKAIEGQA